MFTKLERLARSENQAELGALAQKLSDIFIGTEDEISADEKVNFHYIISHVVDRISGDVAERLSTKLATTDRIDPKTAEKFAYSDDLDVATPMLRNSPVLTDATLIDVANKKSEDHRVAIAQRPLVSEKVTEVLSEVGGEITMETLARNRGAVFNERSLTNIINRAASNSAIPSIVSERMTKDTDLGTLVRTVLGTELRARLEQAGGSITTEEFEKVASQAKAEIDEGIREERVAMLDTMMAKNQIDSGNETLDAAVANAIQKRNFLGALRVLSTNFTMEFENMLNATKKDDSLPLAVLSKAGDLTTDTYMQLEALRCQHFRHRSGKVEEKAEDYEMLTKSDVDQLMAQIEQNVSQKAS